MAAVSKQRRLIVMLLLTACQLGIMPSGLAAGASGAQQPKATKPDNSVQPVSTAETERLRIEAERKAHEKLVKSLLKNPDKIPSLVRSKKIAPSEIPNPHWKSNACGYCHTAIKEQASARNVRHKNIEKNCTNCHHDDIDHNYIHPVNIKLSKIKKKTISQVMQKQLKKSSGNLSCDTCHDIVLQCRLEDRHRHENPMFFRAGPYSKRADLCMNCHQAKDYQRFNPHEQFDKNGKMIDSKCAVCHSGDIDKLKNATRIDQVSFHIKENLNAICWGCHKWKPHPGGGFSFFKSKSGPDHLVTPPEYINEQRQQVMKEKNVLLPLEPGTGKVFCATCHNPHAKGVVKNVAAAKGAESKSRLRSQKICSICHIK